MKAQCSAASAPAVDAPCLVHLIQEIDGMDTAKFGGKAAGLARMAAAGIPVPPAFVISTDAYRAFRDSGVLPEDLMPQVDRAMGVLESHTSRSFGGLSALPLLVSVRSGSQVSMPGMMDTVLNLGITCRGAQRLVQETGNAPFAVDTSVRFWRMFAEIVLNLEAEVIEHAVASLLDQTRREPSEENFLRLETAVLGAIVAQGVNDVSADPAWQLRRAIAAVFESWDSRRAGAYRAVPRAAGSLPRERTPSRARRSACMSELSQTARAKALKPGAAISRPRRRYPGSALHSSANASAPLNKFPSGSSTCRRRRAASSPIPSSASAPGSALRSRQSIERSARRASIL